MEDLKNMYNRNLKYLSILENNVLQCFDYYLQTVDHHKQENRKSILTRFFFSIFIHLGF